MRLSEWRERAPHTESMAPKVVAVIEPVLVSLGGDRDGAAWVVWGDDPGVRYLILAPTELGLVEIHVRVNVPQEGPRASGKLVRWNRVQLGELAIEMAGGHRILSFQVESQVLRGSDDEADAIAAFARLLIAAADGRGLPSGTGSSAGATSRSGTGGVRERAGRREV